MKPRLSQWHQSGATDGQVVTWDNTLMEWVPADPTGGASILDDLSDVDTTTTPPGDGDRLGFDLASGLWVPVAPVDGLPTGGIAGQVLTKQSGTDGDADWETPSGGGGGSLPFDYSTRATSRPVNSTTWAAGDTSTDLVVAASAGDVLAVSLFARVDNENSQLYQDFYTMVAGAPVNSVANASAALTGTTGVGAHVWIGDPSQNFHPAGTVHYVVQAGDISGGTVTLRWYVRNNVGTKTLSTGVRLSVINMGT